MAGRTQVVRPETLPPLDAPARRADLEGGAPLTCWRAEATASPEQVALYGLRPTASQGGSGWLYASVRMVGGMLLLLVGHGKGTEPSWRNVATVNGNQVTWFGLVSPDLVQVARQRLACATLRSLGYKVAEYSTDGNLLPTDKVMVGATCLRCHRALTTPDSLLTGYGPTCGGRVKAPRTWEKVDLASAMRERGKLP